ncbi:S-adenosyl-L-homocysteine hydrolase [Podila verticillata NRRL 6337]|uniref:S-adenosyl-L-homocysteine hydrolase n=1 Tax=Podila verticillata NRRL 6337 TaxID=1069443 RepID=A0A086TJ31_9FUNG|nr:S-adenosyl-L-homocysteine hydrolase [Podila verticillata NRRL 6337]
MIVRKVAVVDDFGEVGMGSAATLKDMAARVIVTEVDPICMLQDAMDGYKVTTMEEAALEGSIFVTTTGGCDLIYGRHLSFLENDATAVNCVNIKLQVDRFQVTSGNHVILLAENRVVNLANATGHLSFIMSSSCSCQVLAQDALWSDVNSFSVGLHRLPKVLDAEVVISHLQKIGAKLTKLHLAIITIEVQGHKQCQLTKL